MNNLNQNDLFPDLYNFWNDERYDFKIATKNAIKILKMEKEKFFYLYNGFSIKFSSSIRHQLYVEDFYDFLYMYIEVLQNYEFIKYNYTRNEIIQFVDLRFKYLNEFGIIKDNMFDEGIYWHQQYDLEIEPNINKFSNNYNGNVHFEEDQLKEVIENHKYTHLEIIKNLIKVELNFENKNIENIFSNKQNKTLKETLKNNKYKNLFDHCNTNYNKYLDYKLGVFLNDLKVNKDEYYKKFLNEYGDNKFCKFKIKENLNKKGIYFFVENNQVMYLGRCLNNFQNRINNGYGNISPKNCYKDGQATNCNINSKINKIQKIEFYIYEMNNKTSSEINQLENYLLKQYYLPWNIQNNNNRELNELFFNID